MITPKTVALILGIGAVGAIGGSLGTLVDRLPAEETTCAPPPMFESISAVPAGGIYALDTGGHVWHRYIDCWERYDK